MNISSLVIRCQDPARLAAAYDDLRAMLVSLGGETIEDPDKTG